MKNFKFLQFLFISVLALGFSACGGDNDDNDDDDYNYPGYINGHEYVDLGLSVKWATCNVGASKPEGYGGYYAWGETEEKSDYNRDTHKWYNNSSNGFTKYCTESYAGRVDNKTTLDPSDDVAHVKWGGSWRMPTADEIEELCDKCTWKGTELNGVNGYRVTGPNGNSIFLPAAGYRDYTELLNRGAYGFYWSSSLNDNDCGRAFYLYSDYLIWDSREYGRSVRPVTE